MLEKVLLCKTYALQMNVMIVKTAAKLTKSRLTVKLIKTDLSLTTLFVKG